MRIATVIGTLTLNRCHSSFHGTRLKVVIPESLDSLTAQSEKEADTVIAWDELGAGSGSRISIAEGPEAAQPFRPEIKPVDCYVSAILDDVVLDPKSLEQIKKQQLKP